MSELAEKEKTAIERLKAFEPEDEPYYLCYSGGKDSDAIRILAQLAGVKHEIHHNLTTVDAPETVRYVRETVGWECVDKPPLTMWQLIVKKKFPPTRLMRYCCSELKERGGKHRKKITGVRWAESAARKDRSALVQITGKPKANQALADELGAEYSHNKFGASIIMNDDNDASRRMAEMCYRTSSVIINPIIDWTDDDVWGFLHHYGCESNPLYQCGYSRIGCIGCPLGGPVSQKREFAQYPKYKAQYIRTFDKMLKAREEAGMETRGTWFSGEAVMKWWIGENPFQMTWDEYLEALEEAEE